MAAIPCRPSRRAASMALSSVSPATNRLATRRPTQLFVASRRNQECSVIHRTGARSSGPLRRVLRDSGIDHPSISGGKWRKLLRELKEPERPLARPDLRRDHLQPLGPKCSEQPLQLSWFPYDRPFRWALGPPEPPHPHSQLRFPTVRLSAPS